MTDFEKELEWKNSFAAYEAEQEKRAYMYKLQRDLEIEAENERRAAKKVDTVKAVSIHELRDRMAEQLKIVSVANKALLRILENQTADEQRNEVVNHSNGVGFTGADGKILTSIAKQLKYKGCLSEKQQAVVMARIQKYTGQLVMGSIAEGKIKKVPGGYTW